MQDRQLMNTHQVCDGGGRVLGLLFNQMMSVRTVCAYCSLLNVYFVSFSMLIATVLTDLFQC